MPLRSSNAYYATDVAALVGASPEEVIGTLVTHSSFSVVPAQRDAWQALYSQHSAEAMPRHDTSAQRLKPHAIDIRVEITPVHWLLNNADDTRSSWYLEDAATEFQVQGLDLDWVCMTWDSDLRFAQSDWSYKRGSRWTLIILFFVPPGDPLDATRAPDYYDSRFAYLSGIGMAEL